MRWLRRHYGKILGLLFLAVLGAGLFLSWQLPNLLEHRVLAAFAAGVGAPVTARTVSFEWPDAFILENIVVGAAEKPVLVASRARLPLDWTATIRARAVRFAAIRLQTPMLNLPLAQEVATALPGFLSNRPTAASPWPELVVEDGMMQWTGDSLSVQVQNIMLQANDWSAGTPAGLTAKGNVSGRWRDHEFSGEARLDAEQAGGEWRLAVTLGAARSTTDAEPLAVEQLVLKWSSADTRALRFTADKLALPPLTLVGLDGELHLADTGFAGQAMAASSTLGQSTLGLFQAGWQWQPGRKFTLAPLRFGQDDGYWEGSWSSVATDSPATVRVALSGRRVPLAPLVEQILPAAAPHCRGNVDAVVRGTFTAWGAARTFEGEIGWVGDSLALGFPPAWEGFNPLWLDAGAAELSPCAMAARLRGTPRLLLLSVLQVRHAGLLVTAAGQATAAGNLQLEVTAVPQRESALRFSEHGGLDIPPGRTAQSRWQVAGTTASPRWDWLTPFPVDTITDPEPYLVPPAAFETWDGDWQRAIVLPAVAPAAAADTAPARRQAVRP